MTVEAPQRFWKFLAFRKPDVSMRIEDIVRLLSTPRSQLSPGDQSMQDTILKGYDAIRNKPFQPHAVARVELLQNFTVRTVVHARVGQHPIDVDAQESDVPGSTGDVGQLPSSAGAGAGARSSFHSSAEPGKTVSRATSTAAIRPISRSNWLGQYRRRGSWQSASSLR